MRIDRRYRPHATAVAQTIAGAQRALREGRLSRREAFRLLGGAGLATAAFMTLGRRAVAQDSGTPHPMATPHLGQQADGSTLWHVKVAEMQMEEQTELMTFFPGEITITEGDAIWFDYGMGAFHTISFLSGGDVPPLFIPDPEAGTPTADALPKVILNPDVMLPIGGDTYDGTGYVNSGIDVFRDPTQPYVLTFTKAGTYDYLCIVHATVMKAKVVVQPAGTAAPHTQADYDRVAQDEIAELSDQAKTEKEQYAQATSTPNADGTTTWEATVGAGGATPVRVQAFLPAELTVKVGDTVRWVHRAPGEPHTVSFIGAGEIPPEGESIEQFADGRPKFVQSNLMLLPQGGDVWSGTGWLNSGLMN